MIYPLLENETSEQYLIRIANDICSDPNRASKVIAACVRNGIEDFHANHLSDDQMSCLNPLIRNAIFSYFKDNTFDLHKLEKEENAMRCFNYIACNTIPFLEKEGINESLYDDFLGRMATGLEDAISYIAAGCKGFTGIEITFVPDYWEDCIYNEKLKSL